MKLPNAWYVVASSKEVGKAKPVSLKRFGLDLVLWRDSNNQVSTLIDLCPHRSVKLSLGHVNDSNCIVCPFHGMSFSKEGVCEHIPETGKPASNLRARSFTSREAFGFVWIWYSTEGLPPVGEPEFFSEIPSGSCTSQIKAIAECHITRAIENQLDYSHLSFVHASSIGRFSDPSREPRYELDPQNIRFFFAHKKTGEESMIAFRMGNIWLNKISKKFVISLAFVPIDSFKTQMYLSTHQNFMTWPLFGHLINRIMDLMNVYVLNEDLRIVKTHPSHSSLDTGTEEKLMASDRAIRHFREIWK